MSWIAIVGTIAATAGIAAFLPQSWKIIKTRKTDGLSAAMWTLQCVGFALWIAYGVGLGKLPIIIPNSICLILSAFILTMKLLPKQHMEKVASAVESAVPGS